MTAPTRPSSSGLSHARLAGLVLLALALSLLFFSPRLWLMRHHLPDTTQWARADMFLKQCADPMRRDVEPAMLWRLLPPLVAHALHLPDRGSLVIPWLGVLAATAYAGVLLRRHCANARFVFGGLLLFACTSAVLVPTGWLGMNDAWVWLGLLAVAFGRSTWAAPVACLLCPWVDERFVIGLPLACLVAEGDSPGIPWRRTLRLLPWLLPYAGLRLALSAQDAAMGETLRAFIAEQLAQNARELPLAPLGWWMGLRAGWVALAALIWLLPTNRRLPAAVALAGTLLLCALLASDLSRSAAIAAPAILGGCFLLARHRPADAPRWVLVLGTANLLLPAAHVTLHFIDPISPLPLELFRVLR